MCVGRQDVVSACHHADAVVRAVRGRDEGAGAWVYAERVVGDGGDECAGADAVCGHQELSAQLLQVAVL